MPIIINEIEIAIEVTPNGNTTSAPVQSAAIDKEEIVRECVEKIMEIINQKNER
jgi:hypothetical protein